MSTISRLLVTNSDSIMHSRNGSSLSKESYPCDRIVSSSDALILKVTDCRAEREEALRLVQRVYSRTGLTDAKSSCIRVMRQHLADETEIIVAKEASEVVFTVTLVRDGEFGLPLESLFEAEVESMRSQGMRLAEVSCLAHSNDMLDSRERFNTFVRGISLLLQTAKRRKVDRLLLAVHPRHAKVYERLFGCVRCSDAKEYAAVKGNPAILCSHDFAKLDQTGYPLYKQIYSKPYDPWQMDGTKMSEAEKQYFEQFLPVGEYEVVPMAA